MSGFTWIRIPASTLHRLMTQRSFLTFQRNAWRDVSREQAQTIATLRKLLIARGPRREHSRGDPNPRPAHSYRDDAYRAAGIDGRQSVGFRAVRAWAGPPANLHNLPRASHSATPPRAMVLGDILPLNNRGQAWKFYTRFPNDHQ